MICHNTFRFSTFLFITSIILSISLNTPAQDSLPSSHSTPTDCVSCQTDLGTAPSLGSAANYAVLGSSTVTSSGLTELVGNLGVSPGTSITGFPPGIVTGATEAGTALAAQAQADSLVAYNDLVGQVCDFDLSGTDLGGLVLIPGVYCFDTSAQLTGILTLDGLGDPNSVFVFQIGSTLTTSAGSSVVLINAETACNVFYQVGSSMTLGSGTEFQGSAIAFTSITINSGANILGRSIALNGAVTLDSNSVTRCNLGSTAAAIHVGGRVTTAQGEGIPRTMITLTDGSGTVRKTYTGTFGYYNFDDIMVGQTVIIDVRNKRYNFPQPTRIISLVDELTNIDFIAD